VVYPVNKYKTSGNNDSPLPLIILTDTWPILFVNLLLTVQKEINLKRMTNEFPETLVKLLTLRCAIYNQCILMLSDKVLIF